MKKNNYNIVLMLLLVLAGCNRENQKKDCIIREWKVIDVYRNNYPSLIDTTCNLNFVLFNKYEVEKSLLDSVFISDRDSKFFSMDTVGTYEIVANAMIEYHGLKYQIAKLSYLVNGYNVDQEILLWIIKSKGIYIQQENDNKKLYLLSKIRNKKNDTENVEEIVKHIMADTILFPLAPSPSIDK